MKRSNSLAIRESKSCSYPTTHSKSNHRTTVLLINATPSGFY